MYIVYMRTRGVGSGSGGGGEDPAGIYILHYTYMYTFARARDDRRVFNNASNDLTMLVPMYIYICTHTHARFNIILYYIHIRPHHVRHYPILYEYYTRRNLRLRTSRLGRNIELLCDITAIYYAI